MIPSAVKKRRGCSSGVCIGLIAAITRPQWRTLYDTDRRGRQTSYRVDEFRCRDSRVAATVGFSAPALASSPRSSGERSARDVVVAHLYGDTFPAEALRKFHSKRRRSMPSAGASQPDGQIALAFAPVQRQQEAEQAHDLVHEAPGLWLIHHVRAHPLFHPV